MGHAPAHAHYEDILDPLEGAQQPGGGAARGDARLPGVPRHRQLGDHTPVTTNVPQGVRLGLSWGEKILNTEIMNRGSHKNYPLLTAYKHKQRVIFVGQTVEQKIARENEK